MFRGNASLRVEPTDSAEAFCRQRLGATSEELAQALAEETYGPSRRSLPALPLTRHRDKPATAIRNSNCPRPGTQRRISVNNAAPLTSGTTEALFDP